MKAVKARTDITADGIKRLTQQAKELGRTTAFTATQIARMEVVLGQKGFDEKEIKSTIEPLLTFARGGGSGDINTLGQDLINAQEILTRSQNIFLGGEREAGSTIDLIDRPGPWFDGTPNHERVGKPAFPPERDRGSCWRHVSRRAGGRRSRAAYRYGKRSSSHVRTARARAILRLENA